MEKITSGMSMDKVFEVMRKVFKGVYKVVVALPTTNDGDVFIVAEELVKALPKYYGKACGWNAQFASYEKLAIAGWFKNVTFIFSLLLEGVEGLKGVSMPLALYNKLNGTTIEVKEKIAVNHTADALGFYYNAFNEKLNAAHILKERDGVRFESNKTLKSFEEYETGFRVSYLKKNAAEYCGKHYEGDLYDTFEFFELSEKDTPKEITKKVEIIIPDSTAKAGEALYILGLDGIMTKRLINKKREVTETESVGFSLSADERRYEEDFRTSTYTIYEHGDKAEIAEEELPEAVKSNSDWIALKNYLQLKETGEFDRLVLKAKEEARKEAKEKAEEFMKTLS